MRSFFERLSKFWKTAQMADTAPPAMAAIDGLTEAQNAALASAQVGQLVFICPLSVQDDLVGDQADDDEQGDVRVDEEEGQVDVEHDGNEAESMSDEPQIDSPAATTDTALEQPRAPAMFVITNLTKSEDGKITQIKMAPQTYSSRIGAETHSYHIHGRTCKTYHACGESCALAKTIAEVTSKLQAFAISLDPHGDYVRRFIATNGTRMCIAQCNDGWLTTIDDLDDLIRNYVSPLKTGSEYIPQIFRPPVCPVCISKSLLQEQQALQHEVLSSMVATDLIGKAHEFNARLNVRRGQAGYDFIQFDEREWGFYFDDMLSEDEEGWEVEDDDRFQVWAEANDPANNATTHPVSDVTIAALPRKTATETEREAEMECQVCKQELESDAVLIELPCNHSNFHEECLVPWLKQSDGCPNCRALVPDIEGKPRETVTREAGHYPSAPRAAAPELFTSARNRHSQRDAYQMTTDEARRFLNIDGIALEEIDKDMLVVMFEAARSDHGGDRTENAIKAIQIALGIATGGEEDQYGDEDAEGEYVDDDEGEYWSQGTDEDSVDEDDEDDEDDGMITPRNAATPRNDADADDAAMSDT